jgi:HK97 family phage major capsid protein
MKSSKPFTFHVDRDKRLSAMFATSDAATLRALKAATNPTGDVHVADQHRQRNAMATAARAVMDAAVQAGRPLTEQEQLAADGFLDLADEIANRISLAEGSRQHFKGGAGERWIDAEGREVRVLSKDDRVADLGPVEQRFSAGSLMRAMAGIGRPDAAVRNALSEGTDSAGGVTVPDELSREMIDRMRANLVVGAAGARTVPMTSDNLKFARQVADPAAAWRNENALVAESDPTFDAVTLQARSLAVIVKASVELLQDSVNIEAALNNALAQALAREIDRVAMFGSGTAPEPRGVYTTAGISTISMGTNGAAIGNYDPIVDAVTALASANAPAPTAAIMAPRTFGSLSKVKDSTGQPITAPAIVSGLPMLRTTAVPINQTQGTSTIASSILVGDFSNLLIGVRQSLRIELLRGPFMDRLQVGFLAHLRADVAVAQPAAFCRIVGVL